MKVNFKVKNNKLFSDNQKMIDEYAISLDLLIAIMKLANHTAVNALELSQKKVVYFSLNDDEEMTFKTCKGFLVRTNEGIKVWSNEFYDIENGNVIFSTKEEAQELTEAKNLFMDFAYELAKLM